MARNRMLKKDFFGDPKVGSLPLGCRLLFQSLWIFADDTGHGIAAPQLLKAQAFPYDDIAPGQISDWLGLLSKAGMVRCYEVSGQEYFQVLNFAKHQVISRPSHFAYPKPNQEPLPKSSGGTQGALSEHSMRPPAVLNEEAWLKGKIKRKDKEESGSANAPQHFANRKISDTRFEALKKSYIEGFAKKSPNLKPPFDGSDAKSLQGLLTRQPEAMEEVLISWLKNAFDSHDVPPLRPMFRLREFCSHAEKFANGPLRRGGAPVRSALSDNSEASRLEEMAQ